MAASSRARPGSSPVAVPAFVAVAAGAVPGPARPGSGAPETGCGVQYPLPEDSLPTLSLPGFRAPRTSGPEAGGAVTREAAIAALVGSRLADVERALIEATLERHGGAVARAALILGVSPSTLYRKCAGWAEAMGGGRRPR